jgi:hypothetical protein
MVSGYESNVVSAKPCEKDVRWILGHLLKLVE